MSFQRINYEIVNDNVPVYIHGICPAGIVNVNVSVNVHVQILFAFFVKRFTHASDSDVALVVEHDHNADTALHVFFVFIFETLIAVDHAGHDKLVPANFNVSCAALLNVQSNTGVDVDDLLLCSFTLAVDDHVHHVLIVQVESHHDNNSSLNVALHDFAASTLLGKYIDHQINVANANVAIHIFNHVFIILLS